MKRMASLGRRLSELNRRIRTLRNQGAANTTIQKVIEARDNTVEIREDLRNAKLY